MEKISHAKAKRRKENSLETRQRFAPLRLGARNLFLLLILIFLTALVPIARADGGVVLWQRTSAPFTITLFSTEVPLRPGVADLSVLVESTEGHSPILDARVLIELEHEGGTIIRAEATRSQAQNKLLYCSLINIPQSGQWKMRLHVRRGDSNAEVLSELTVAARQAVLLSYWKLIALPAITVIFFICNQWFQSRQLRNRIARTLIKHQILDIFAHSGKTVGPPPIKLKTKAEG